MTRPLNRRDLCDGQQLVVTPLTERVQELVVPLVAVAVAVALPEVLALVNTPLGPL
jgi:hypothetical protein